MELMSKNERVIWHLGLEKTQEPWGSVVWASWHQTKQLKELLVIETPDYVVAHYAAKGCTYENGFMAPRGWEMDYKEGYIKQWFIGDIHARQKVAANAWYPGSPCQLNFGEGGSKGFDIYYTETDKRDQILLSKSVPLMTMVCKDKVPEILEGVLYRAYVSKEFLSYPFPPNVVSIQMLESRTKGNQLVDNASVSEEIDFGDPLAGIEEVLERSKLPESLYAQATAIAAAMVMPNAETSSKHGSVSNGSKD
jgi:DNA repair exonuclease SbcCD nuclease subunit